MQATSSLLIKTGEDVVLQCSSSLSVEAFEPAYCLMAASSEAYAIGNGNGYGGGSGELPAMVTIGGFDNPGSGQGYGYLPAFESTGTGGQYVPTTTTIGYGSFPMITGSAVGVKVGVGSGDGDMPPIAAMGGDHVYGQARETLPAFESFGMYGISNYEAEMIDFMICGGSVSGRAVMSVVFISDGTLSDTMTLTRVQALQFISDMEASDSMSLIGTYTQSFIDTLTAQSHNSQNVITATGVTTPDLNSEGMVWVVNIDTGASSQYEDYGFNSFFNRGGETYGVASDGIYRLDGDDDVGINIEALAEFGKSDFGASFKRKIPYVYLGIGSSGSMYLKVNSDGEEYVYEMRNNSETMENHRVDVGKGLEGNYWNFTLINKNGSDFDMDTIQFEPIISSRRIH